MGALTVAGAEMNAPVHCWLPLADPVVVAVADCLGATPPVRSPRSTRSTGWRK